jgi:hypothetical protein
MGQVQRKHLWLIAFFVTTLSLTQPQPIRAQLFTRIGHTAIPVAIGHTAIAIGHAAVSVAAESIKLPYRSRRRIGHTVAAYTAVSAKPSPQLTRIGHAVVSPKPPPRLTRPGHDALSTMTLTRPRRRIGHDVVAAAAAKPSPRLTRIGHDVVSAMLRQCWSRRRWPGRPIRGRGRDGGRVGAMYLFA